jgi:hypothetical protein
LAEKAGLSPGSVRGGAEIGGFSCCVKPRFGLCRRPIPTP